MPEFPETATIPLTFAAASTRQVGGVFVVIEGVDRGKQCRFRSEPIVIGSASTCDLVLEDPSVSRYHLSVARRGDEIVLSDQDSTNGSFVQGARFKEISIGFGTEVRIGQTVLKYMPEEELVEPEASQQSGFGALFGQTQRMRQLFRLLEEVATADTTVLLEGETGTGKELVAEEIHKHSHRSARAFVVFDCGAVSRELLASALFGHVKGSFTGASSDRKGAFAAAQGGTLFLDEIGELSPELQTSLLRALDKKMVCRVGADEYEAVDVRIIAATNRDLRAAITTGNFREDLYYRLEVLRIVLPPLRERLEDLPALAERFVSQFASGRSLRITHEDQQFLLRRPWAGNVRELRNLIERACLMSTGATLNIRDALAESTAEPVGQSARESPVGFRAARARFEYEFLEDLMKRHRGNLSTAAEEAALDRKRLRELLDRHKLRPPRSESSD